MAFLLGAIFTLLLIAIALLVMRGIRRVLKAKARRPRQRDLVAPHIQERRIDNALIRYLVRQQRPQGVTPAGVAVRKAIIKKQGRGR